MLRNDDDCLNVDVMNGENGLLSMDEFSKCLEDGFKWKVDSLSVTLKTLIQKVSQLVIQSSRKDIKIEHLEKRIAELEEIQVNKTLSNTSKVQQLSQSKCMMKPNDKIQNCKSYADMVTTKNPANKNREMIIEKEEKFKLKNNVSNNYSITLRNNNGESNLSKFKEEVNSEFKEVNVLKTKSTNNGDILIFLPDQESKNKAEDIINNSNQYEVIKNPILEPKMALHGVNKQISNDDLMKAILHKNDNIKELKNQGKSFDIQFVKEGKFSNMIIFKVDAAIRNVIIANKNRLYFDMEGHYMTDHKYVKQCFKCQRFGHISEKCKQNDTCCMYCSLCHNSKDCPNKQDQTKYRCSNCVRSSNIQIKENANHTSSSRRCPYIQREICNLEELISNL